MSGVLPPLLWLHATSSLGVSLLFFSFGFTLVWVGGLLHGERRLENGMDNLRK
jgi:hypothetical protein